MPIDRSRVSSRVARWEKSTAIWLKGYVLSRFRSADDAQPCTQGDAMSVLLMDHSAWRGMSPLLAAGVLLGAACSPSMSGHHEDLDAERLQSLVLHEVVRIGSSTNPDTGFTRVASALWDEDGNIYIVEAAERQIRVYDELGRMRTSIGRRGNGPGEFRSVPRIQVLGDTIWALDRTQQRITLFSRNGRLLEEHAFEPPLVQVPVEAVFSGSADMRSGTQVYAAIMPHYALDGRVLSSELIETGGRREAGSVDTGSVRVPRLVFEPSGVIRDSLGWYVRAPPHVVAVRTLSAGGKRYVVPPPPLDIPLSQLTAVGVITVERTVPSKRVAARFRVTSVTAWGDTVYSLAFRYDPLGYPSAVLDSLALSSAWAPWAVPQRPATKVGWWEIGWQLAPEGNQQTVAEARMAQGRIRARMRYPPFQPPIQELFAGSDGSLWLRREETGGTTYRWMYLDRHGRMQGVAEFPRSGFALLFGEHDRLLARVTDDDGIPWVIGYKIGFGPRTMGGP
jgi:hypothetical protein